MDNRILNCVLDKVISIENIRIKPDCYETAFAIELIRWFSKKTDHLDDKDKINYYKKCFKILYAAAVETSSVELYTMKSYTKHVKEYFNKHSTDDWPPLKLMTAWRHVHNETKKWSKYLKNDYTFKESHRLNKNKNKTVKISFKL